PIRLCSPCFRFNSSPVHCRFSRQGFCSVLDRSGFRAGFSDQEGPMQRISTVRRAIAGLAAVAALAAAPLAAQSIETFDPDTAIDADLEEAPGSPPVYSQET